MALADALLFFVILYFIVAIAAHDFHWAISIALVTLLPPTLFVYWRCLKAASHFYNGSANLAWAIKQGAITGALVGLSVAACLILAILGTSAIIKTELLTDIAKGVVAAVALFSCTGTLSATIIYKFNKVIFRANPALQRTASGGR